MRKLPAPTAADTLRVLAVSRLVLDNVPHVKAFWIATGVEVAQIALWFGVDDLDGTVQEEKIYHMAGARTPEAMSTADIRRLIRRAGREPVERDTLYNVVTGPEAPDEVAARRGMSDARPDVWVVAVRAAGVIACRSTRGTRPTRQRASEQSARWTSKLLTDFEKQSIGERQPLPERYLRLSDDELDARIAGAKATLGERCVILGHHYQRDEVIKFADYIGDSLKLVARGRDRARRPTTSSSAACTSWRRAPTSSARRTRRSCCPTWPPAARWPTWRRPISSRSAGARWSSWASAPTRSGRTAAPASFPSPTSTRRRPSKRSSAPTAASSAPRPTPQTIMTWAWERGEKLLMLPDQHLGRNTAFKMGVPLEQMVVWDPNEMWGGLDADQVKAAKLILWKGHCSVHTRFTVPQIEAFRKKYPEGRVVAHPECTLDVVRAADESGSTEYIINTVKASPPGTVWAVATEIHLVNRLTAEVPDKTIVTLDPFGCLCSTMFRVSPNHLLWILEGLVEGKIYNQITVPEPTRIGRQAGARSHAGAVGFGDRALSSGWSGNLPVPIEGAAEWRTKSHRFRTTTTRWSRTSTNRRCGSITTSTTPLT